MGGADIDGQRSRHLFTKSRWQFRIGFLSVESLVLLFPFFGLVSLASWLAHTVCGCWFVGVVRAYVCCVLCKRTSRASAMCPILLVFCLKKGIWTLATGPSLCLLFVSLPVPPAHTPSLPSLQASSRVPLVPARTASPTMHFAMSNDEDPNGAVVSRLKRELFDLEEASVRNLQARKDMERQMDQLRQQVGGGAGHCASGL